MKVSDVVTWRRCGLADSEARGKCRSVPDLMRELDLRPGQQIFEVVALNFRTQSVFRNAQVAPNVQLLASPFAFDICPTQRTLACSMPQWLTCAGILAQKHVWTLPQRQKELFSIPASKPFPAIAAAGGKPSHSLPLSYLFVEHSSLLGVSHGYFGIR